jgi:putative tricarboxylic transport membrane protein
MHRAFGFRRVAATGAVISAACIGLGGTPPLAAASLEAPECVVPAKAGGGFDLTCKLAQALLRDTQAGKQPLAIRYVPGGIGAVAYDRLATQTLSDPGVLVAFSSGSLLNLVQGKFGPHSAADVRWVAAIGTDYGVIAVPERSAIRSLKDLMDALRKDGTRLAFGAGGTVGSQDWIKAALLVRAAGRDHKAMRFVSFEGGGEALAALKGGHVEVFTGDAAEARQALREGGGIRLIAVLAEKRLPGVLAGVPTATEQGVDLVWPTVRGLYLGRGVSDADYRHWVDALHKATASAPYAQLAAEHGLYPFALTGAALEAFVHKSSADYRALAAQLGLRTSPRTLPR